MLVSAGTNLQFHSLHNGPTITYEPLQTGSITSISLSKENGFLVFVTENERPEIISLKCLATPRNVHTITAVSGTSAIAFGRTTKRIIGLGTTSGQVAFYDTKTKTICKLFQSAEAAVNLLDFSVCDKKMAVSSMNGSILIYDTKNTEVYDRYKLSNYCCPTAMRFHPNEKHLLMVGVEEGTLMQWNVDTGHNVFSLSAHTAAIIDLVPLRNSTNIVSVGYDHKFCIHDSNTRKCIFRSNLQYPLTAVDASSDGYNLAIGTLFGDLYIYDTRYLLQPISSRKAHNTRINKILFDRTSKDDFIEVIPEESNESYALHKELFLTSSNNFYEPSKEDAIDTPCTNNYSLTEDTSQDAPDMEKDSSCTALKSVKEKVSHAIYKGAEEVRFNITEHLKKLQNFVVSEFTIIGSEIEEKWDIQNLTTVPSEDTESKIITEEALE